MRCLQLTCKLIFANNVASSSSVTKTSVTFGSLPKFFLHLFLCLYVVLPRPNDNVGYGCVELDMGNCK